MWTALFWIINLFSIALVYSLWIRPIIRRTPALAQLFAKEDSYLAAFRLKFSGIKQRLTAGIVYLAGVIVTVHDYLAPKLTGVDVAPLFPKVVATIPTEAWPLVAIGITALLDYFRYLADKRSE